MSSNLIPTIEASSCFQQKKKTMKLNQIFNLAKKVRHSCDLFVMSEKAYWYDFYNRSDLSCMCLAASQIMQEVLRIRGINSYLAVWGDVGGYNMCHSWLQVGKVVVDLTHSQFGSPDIVIAPSRSKANKMSNFNFYHLGKRMTNECFVNWPESQQLTKEFIDIFIEENTLNSKRTNSRITQKYLIPTIEAYQTHIMENTNEPLRSSLSSSSRYSLQELADQASCGTATLLTICQPG